ncbi:DUF2252 family protein [bacterium]|nr:DUF2252 family protein [bacterium]
MFSPDDNRPARFIQRYVSGLDSGLAGCGMVRARAHARSGDPAQIAGCLGTCPSFEQAATESALAYADQTEHDHARLVEGIASGRLQARSE